MTDIKLEELLERIYAANKEEINPILNAITERFSEIWPEWELMTLSVQGHDNDHRIKALQKSMDLLCNHK